MNYIFSGNLRGCYINNCFDPIYKSRVKIYGIDRSINVSSNIELNTPETIHIQSENEISNIATFLLAETETDELGNYSVELSKIYDGGTLDIDICCSSAPIDAKLLNRDYQNYSENQFQIATVQPFWQVSPEGTALIYDWKYEVGAKLWASLLKVFKLHIICGRVSHVANKQAIAEARVFVFDLDLLQDDYLGMAVADQNGCFKLFYSDDDYQKTIFKNISSEWKNCPDLYFRVENKEGELLLKEDRKCGNYKNRKNVDTCLVVDFQL